MGAGTMMMTTRAPATDAATTMTGPVSATSAAPGSVHRERLSPRAAPDPMALGPVLNPMRCCVACSVAVWRRARAGSLSLGGQAETPTRGLLGGGPLGAAGPALPWRCLFEAARAGSSTTSAPGALAPACGGGAAPRDRVRAVVAAALGPRRVL